MRRRVIELQRDVDHHRTMAVIYTWLVAGAVGVLLGAILTQAVNVMFVLGLGSTIYLASVISRRRAINDHIDAQEALRIELERGE